MPKTVRNIDGAISFVGFILSKNSSQLLKSQGLNPINITSEGEIDNIPLILKKIL
ncbi:MAG: hypothetical protein WKF36_10600 [Candidatus Nitrosocosmicus sp.]